MLHFSCVMNEIRIETKYTAEDYIRTETFLKNPGSPSGFIINFGSAFLFVFAVILTTLACFALVDGKFERAFFGGFMGLFTFFCVYKLLTLYNLSVRMFLSKRALRRYFNPNSVLFTERRIVFAEEGITETHEFGNYLTRWEGIFKVTETDADFYFYLENTLRFQPKRDISEEQTDRLRILIKANLRENAPFELLTTT